MQALLDAGTARCSSLQYNHLSVLKIGSLLMDHDYAFGRGILVVILLLASASPSKRATCMRLSPIPASAPASEALLRLTAFSVVLSSVCALAVQLFPFAVLFNYLVETHVNSLWTI